MTRASDSIGRLDLEWIAMQAGLKPTIRVTVEPEHADAVAARARRDGCAVERAAHVIEFPGRAPSVVLYLARDANRARELVGAEAPLLPVNGRPLPLDEALPLHTRLGELLGFPRCCIDAFCARLRRGVTRRLDGRDAHEDFVAAEDAARASHRFLARLNDLSPDRRARIVTFYPCRYDCPTASTYAAGVFTQAERVHPAAAAELRTALLGRVSILTDGTRGRPDAADRAALTVDFRDF